MLESVSESTTTEVWLWFAARTSTFWAINTLSLIWMRPLSAPKNEFEFFSVFDYKDN